MKKNIAIFLIVSLTAPFVGTYFYFQYSKSKIRKEITGLILNGLDKKTLVLLKFTDEESVTKLKWKHAGEFDYNGQMYDIVEKRREGDTTFYNCYKDHKETRLNSRIKRLVNWAMGHDPYQKSQTAKIVTFFKSVYRQEVFSWTVQTPSISIFHFSFFIFNYSSLAFTPPSPPPKLG